MATEPKAKHQHLDKSLKMKYKALKELENGTTHRDVASLFGAPKNTHPNWKKMKKKSSSRKEVTFGLRE